VGGGERVRGEPGVLGRERAVRVRGRVRGRRRDAVPGRGDPELRRRRAGLPRVDRRDGLQRGGAIAELRDRVRAGGVRVGLREPVSVCRRDAVRRGRDRGVHGRGGRVSCVGGRDRLHGAGAAAVVRCDERGGGVRGRVRAAVRGRGCDGVRRGRDRDVHGGRGRVSVVGGWDRLHDRGRLLRGERQGSGLRVVRRGVRRGGVAVQRHGRGELRRGRARVPGLDCGDRLRGGRPCAAVRRRARGAGLRGQDPDRRVVRGRTRPGCAVRGLGSGFRGRLRGRLRRRARSGLLRRRAGRSRCRVRRGSRRRAGAHGARGGRRGGRHQHPRQLQRERLLPRERAR